MENYFAGLVPLLITMAFVSLPDPPVSFEGSKTFRKKGWVFSEALALE